MSFARIFVGYRLYASETPVLKLTFASAYDSNQACLQFTSTFVS